MNTQIEHVLHAIAVIVKNKDRIYKHVLVILFCKRNYNLVKFFV